MAATHSTGISLSSDFFMRKFYVSNVEASKTSTRSKYSKAELGYEDSRALKVAKGKLASYKYSEEEDDETVKNTVEAFVKTYNNLVESAGSDRSMKRYLSQLKALTSKYEDELSKAGITPQSDGTLKISENLLKSADMKELSDVFSSKGDFATKTAQIAKRINSFQYSNLMQEITGNGLQINIIL